ncbi:MAG: DUF5107 domain-containing protein [Bacteroidia bacterium]
MKRFLIFLFLHSLLTLNTEIALAQHKARISEDKKPIKTYPYDDPNPIPILGSNPKIYPYHKFEGYSHEGKPMDWNVVTLENDYIAVYVLPDAGGKVYGAVEKSTGEEFIYMNDVMKFRNISMRGPWTSGGIEFNFGIIGHHPSTASPVDYQLVENQDGSVSCWVGTMDLPSRTHWRVEVRLPADKAFFETRVLWYNPTPLHQSYYNWMTAAAAATSDLELFCPGDTYLTHPGDPMSWPYDPEGRHIAEYKFNNYGPSKSYHVVGEYNNFFGGYFHDKNFGFGHSSLYEEMPGQKLWLWALSRSGGIWEDLLTDTDGQYIEFQAGRLFDKYSPEGYNNPITQVGFSPGSADTWRELWFPVKQTGGISAVSEKVVMHIQRNNGQIRIILNALAEFSSPVEISLGGAVVKNAAVSLSPMEVETITLADGKGQLNVRLSGADIDYTSDPEALAIDRPFEGKPPFNQNTPSFHYFDGVQEMEYRNFTKAALAFEKCISMDPWHIDARVRLAEIYFHDARYDKALEVVRQALNIDTYHPGANFVAGIIYRAKENPVNALECLGWAARSPQYRSAAYSEMAQVSLTRRDYPRVIQFADKAIASDPLQIPAIWAKAVAYRMTGNKEACIRTAAQILDIDPLSHLAKTEKYLAEPSDAAYQPLIRLNNEFPHETFLETGIQYANAGLYQDAISILTLGPTHTKNLLWIAWMNMKTGTGQDIPLLNSTVGRDPDFVFPYRRESLKVMDWAFQIKAEWKTAWFLGLNYWALNQKEQTKMIFNALGNQPDYAPFYIARSDLGGGSYADVAHALSLDPKTWRYHHLMIEEEWKKDESEAALAKAKSAAEKFPENYTIGFDLAKALVNAEKYAEAVQQFDRLNILPFEGASESRNVYEQALLYGALEAIQQKNYRQADIYLKKSLEWPENLGVGKPYDVDESITYYLLGISAQKRNRKKDAEAWFKQAGDKLPAGKGWKADLMEQVRAL